MPFKILKQVIAHLRQKASCPYCQTKFNENSIAVVATTAHPFRDASSGLFMVVCPKCNSQAMLGVEVGEPADGMPGLTEEQIRVMMTPSDKISTNEVLDMHNFLKHWKGDVTELFKE